MASTEQAKRDKQYYRELDRQRRSLEDESELASDLGGEPQILDQTALTALEAILTADAQKGKT